MKYTVTIKNDSEFFNGEGIVHTWLEFNKPGESTGKEVTEYFGFSPKNDLEYFNVEGAFDKAEYLKNSAYSESKTFEMTKEQYERMKEEIGSFNGIAPVYDIMPDDSSDSDYNCTKIADQILESAGIDYLSGIESPFGVANKINGVETDGLAQSALDAKDYMDEVYYDILNNLDKLQKDVGAQGNSFIDDLMQNSKDMLDESKAAYNNVIDFLNGDSAQNSSVIDEFADNFKNGLKNFEAGLKYLLTVDRFP